MADKKEWEKFTIICHRCGRHDDEGVHATLNNDGVITIKCPCGEEEGDG